MNLFLSGRRLFYWYIYYLSGGHFVWLTLVEDIVGNICAREKIILFKALVAILYGRVW